MRYFRLFICAVFLFFVVALSSLNSNMVQLHFYLGTAHLILSFLLLITLLVGMLVSCLAFLPIWLKSKSLNRHLRMQLQCMQKEIKNLRHLPIQDGEL